MATNSKGWTALLPVKVFCFILIPALAFAACVGAAGIITGEFNDLGILLADIYANDYFYDAYVPDAFAIAQTVFQYQSESHIRDMGCLEWIEEKHSVWDEKADDFIANKGFKLVDKYSLYWGRRDWGVIDAPSIEPANSEVKRLIDLAIIEQLNNFAQLKKTLAETKGLYYLFTDGDRVLTNLAEERGADFFRSHPVYLIRENNSNIISSRQNGERYSPRHYYYDANERLSGYVAFSSDAVNAQNAAWAAAQAKLGFDLFLIIASALMLLLLLLILMAGAGRRRGLEGVSFNLLDKPWLDCGFVALASYSIAVCVGFAELAGIAMRYESFGRIIALCAALSVLLAIPAAAWLMSFAKRCKAGKWWRHTLIYIILHAVYSGIKRFVKSLWAGLSLTVKTALAGLALFMGFLACVALEPPEAELIVGVIFTAATIFLMLRHARKLHLVEQGAKAAAAGSAGGGGFGGGGGVGRAQAQTQTQTKIAVKGGVLGSIADSINNISDGINVAVAERLKSERFKTELITNISHDIRTPLTSLITYADLLKSEGADSPRAAEYLDILIQKSARLKTLTDDLFEASKAAGGNIDVNMETLDLADFIRQALGEMDARIQDSGLSFRLNLPEHAPVQADGKLLWRVIDNLLSNVFKYALAGSRVYIDLAPESGQYRLDIKNISDRPLNIDPSELTERFKRGDEARGGEGSGLGLSIAQSFVQAQGGRFSLSIDGDLFKASVSLPGRTDGEALYLQ